MYTDATWCQHAHALVNVWYVCCMQATDAEAQVMLRRCCKIITHELCHIFGISHCVYYHCLMCGKNNTKEQDASPLFLCTYKTLYAYEGKQMHTHARRKRDTGTDTQRTREGREGGRESILVLPSLQSAQ